MNRISKIFQKKQPFIGYLTGGDGGVDYFVKCALALIDGGVDILEIGLPFSDPVADGPVIESAHKRALENGTTSSTLLEIARALRKRTETPLILFSYYNPLLQKGELYLQALKAAGFDAVLVVDLPAPALSCDQEPFFKSLKAAELLPILLVTPTTDQKRLIQIDKSAEGFLYYVSQKGTTGVRAKLANDFSFQMARIRKHTKLPIAAGFGIADQESAKAALLDADGFVVGSAFVKLMERHVDPHELTLLAQAIGPRS
jgi:tryptophan synthase alpha chain